MPKDKTETHERIIPAAMKIFLEKGFEKATMREIAEEAGITAAGLYRHFVDKEAMFAALVEPVLSELPPHPERTLMLSTRHIVTAIKCFIFFFIIMPSLR